MSRPHSRRPSGFEHAQDLHHAQVPALHILGQPISHRVSAGKLAEAERHAQSAVDNLATTDFIIWHPDVLIIFGEHERHPPATAVAALRGDWMTGLRDRAARFREQR